MESELLQADAGVIFVIVILVIVLKVLQPKEWRKSYNITAQA